MRVTPPARRSTTQRIAAGFEIRIPGRFNPGVIAYMGAGAEIIRLACGRFRTLPGGATASPDLRALPDEAARDATASSSPKASDRASPPLRCRGHLRCPAAAG